MKYSIFEIQKYHLVVILALIISATYWTMATDDALVSAGWLLSLLLLIIFSDVSGLSLLFKRLFKISLLLGIVSLFQIIFRRSGDVLLEINSFPVVYQDGFQQAVLLWMRYMVIFQVAFLFSRIKMFDFFVFLIKSRVSYAFVLLLLVTLRFLPFMAHQARVAFWTMRFHGMDFKKLKLKEKIFYARKLIKPVLHAGIHYAFMSSLALELRGYGTIERIKLQNRYPLRGRDIVFLMLILFFNLLSIKQVL